MAGSGSVMRPVLAAGAFLGAVACLAIDSPRFEGFGVARPAASALAPSALAPAPEDLSARFTQLARTAGITPAQMPAWEAFTADMRRLEALTRAFEARVAAGGQVDAPRERAAHALLFGSALSTIEGSLAPRQADEVRRAMDGLVPGLICRTLAPG